MVVLIEGENGVRLQLEYNQKPAKRVAITFVESYQLLVI